VILGASLFAIAVGIVTELLLRQGGDEVSPLATLLCVIGGGFLSIFAAVNMGYQAGRREGAKKPDQIRDASPYSEQPIPTGTRSSENVTVLRETTNITRN
jgi:hypothetical protein